MQTTTRKRQVCILIVPLSCMQPDDPYYVDELALQIELYVWCMLHMTHSDITAFGTHGVDNDWHVLATQEQALAKLQSLQLSESWRDYRLWGMEVEAAFKNRRLVVGSVPLSEQIEVNKDLYDQENAVSNCDVMCLRAGE